MFKYLHDQTVRLANEGYDGQDIASMMQSLPPSLSKDWTTHPYYGSPQVASRAIYSYYLGWYDGDPANLNRLSRTEEAKKFVEYMGGIRNVYTQAKKDYDKGNYRFVATVLSKAVFANPENGRIRGLLADTYTQLGYQSENATWRNIYLMAARELRHPELVPVLRTTVKGDNMSKAMPFTDMLDYLTIHLNGPKAEGITLSINLNETSSNKKYLLTLQNDVLDYTEGQSDPKANLTLTGNKLALLTVLSGKLSIEKAITDKKITATGDKSTVIKLSSILDEFKYAVPLVTPIK